MRLIPFFRFILARMVDLLTEAGIKIFFDHGDDGMLFIVNPADWKNSWFRTFVMSGMFDLFLIDWLLIIRYCPFTWDLQDETSYPKTHGCRWPSLIVSRRFVNELVLWILALYRYFNLIRINLIQWENSLPLGWPARDTSGAIKQLEIFTRWE